jgi:hypothetical protein
VARVSSQSGKTWNTVIHRRCSKKRLRVPFAPVAGLSGDWGHQAAMARSPMRNAQARRCAASEASRTACTGSSTSSSTTTSPGCAKDSGPKTWRVVWPNAASTRSILRLVRRRLRGLRRQRGVGRLRSILAVAGVTKPPILDGFHIAMRLQHTTQAASGLSTDDPDQVQAKAVIVAEVERLR